MKFIECEKVTNEEKAHIFQALLNYNLSNLEEKIVKDIGIFVEDEKGTRVAGLIGETHGNWLEVEYLWVSEALRGQHIGTKLMRKAEKIAINRGCKFAALNTFSFQAPDFYVKLGYKEEFVLTHYPLTGKRYYYTKKL